MTKRLDCKAMYSIKIGEMRVSSGEPVTPSIRTAILKSVRLALAEMNGDLGNGCTLEFDVVKD